MLITWMEQSPYAQKFVQQTIMVALLIDTVNYLPTAQILQYNILQMIQLIYVYNNALQVIMQILIQVDVLSFVL